MPAKEFICIQCEGYGRACKMVPGGNVLPILCGPDSNGFTRVCDWKEVPQKHEKGIIGFPDQIARPKHTHE